MMVFLLQKFHKDYENELDEYEEIYDLDLDPTEEVDE